MSGRYRIGREHVLLIIIVVVGVAARLYGVHYNFDGDEIFTVKLVSKPFTEVISLSLQDRPHPPLHNVLLHIWIKVFGVSEVSVRAMSVVLSGAFLLLSYGLFRRLVSAWLALGLVAILALSPHFVYYGQQARPYALIAFLSAANLLAFLRVLDGPHERKRVAIWAVSCVLLLYAQYLAILIIIFEIGFALFSLRSERLAILAYGSGASALIVPWFITAMGSAISAGVDPLPSISWIEPPTPAALPWFYIAIFGDAPWLPASLLLLMLAFLIVAYIKNLVSSKNLPARHVLLLLIGTGIPAIVYLVSVWGPKPVFASRQLIGAAIAFLAATGVIIATLPRRFGALLLVSLVVWTTAALSKTFLHNRKPPWRDMAAQIDEQYGSTAVFTQEGWVGKPLEYYLKVASVRMWSAVAEHEKDQEFLFACRAHKCSDIETEALLSRRSLVSAWRWGKSGHTERNQLVLYRVKGVGR